MNEISTFATILILATLAESLVEHLIKPILQPEPEPSTNTETDAPVKLPPALRDILLRYIAAVFGILLCLAYDADLLALLGLQSATPFVGQLITGIVVGRGANYLHDLLGRWGLPAAGCGPDASTH